MRSGDKIENAELKSVLIADETTRYRSMLELSYPLKEGIVQNWEDMELVWDYAFTEKMNITNLSERNILLTEAANNPKSNRKKMAEVMFEKFNLHGLNFQT